MNPQSVVIRCNSARLKVAFVKAVSVTPYVVAGVPGVIGKTWMVVPQAAKPGTKTLVAAGAADGPGNTTVDALHVGAPDEASSLITMDVGTPGVRVLLIKSLRAERETNPSGVIGQVQQETSCSSGEKVYTFMQRLPF